VKMARTPKVYNDIASLNDEQKRRLKAVIGELSESMKRRDDERTFQSEGVGDISDELVIDKKIVKKLVKTFYKDSYDEDVETFETFETWYDSLLK